VNAGPGRKLEEARAELFNARFPNFKTDVAATMAVQRAERAVREAKPIGAFEKVGPGPGDRTDRWSSRVTQLHGFLTLIWAARSLTWFKW